MADSAQISRVFGEAVGPYSDVGTTLQQTFIKAQVTAAYTDTVPTAQGARIFSEVTAAYTDVPTAKRALHMFVEVIAPAGTRNRRLSSILMG